MNQWCCICGFILSMGVLKEYIDIGGILAGKWVWIFGIRYELNHFLNSILTSVLYYLSMPCVMILSMYFCRLNATKPRLFSVLCFLAFIPALVFMLVYPWAHIREFYRKTPQAFQIAGIYNLVYGVAATVPMLWSLHRERENPQFFQRRLMCVIGLLPLWYWLITLFLFHLLELKKLYKLWQGNAFILLFIFFYYVNHLFREGIWGLRLNREYFDWSEEASDLPGNILYLIHMLKGETSKIACCVQMIRESGTSGTEDELNIIEHSATHIDDFVQRTNVYSRKITLMPEQVDMYLLFQKTVEKWRKKWNGQIIIEVDGKNPFLYCDYHHMEETLSNLTGNAIEAMGESGILTLTYQVPRRKIALIQIADTGPGFSREEALHIFQPFYTGKSDAVHLGLGLSYCRKVVNAHKGYIQVKSRTDASHGTTFTICLPLDYKKKGKKQNHESSYSNTDCR